jgi:Kinesin motor domain
VRASFLELYNEEVRDLLTKMPTATLVLREGDSGRSVHSLSAFVVRSSAEMHRLLEVGPPLDCQIPLHHIYTRLIESTASGCW